MYKKHWWYGCPLHNSLDSRFHHSPLGVWFNLPCLTVWILGSPFILLYLPPHLHELFEVSTIHAATDPRSSFSFYTPQAYRNPVASRRIRPISCFYTIKPWFGCSYKYSLCVDMAEIFESFIIPQYLVQGDWRCGHYDHSPLGVHGSPFVHLFLHPSRIQKSRNIP